MYEIRYGNQAKATADLSVKEIAVKIRQDIKTAKTAGDLPADLKVSVRYETASMMSAIEVWIRYRPEFWQKCDGTIPGSMKDIGDGWAVGESCHDPGHRWDDNYDHEVLSVEGRRIHDLVKAIHTGYNYDGSETMVDYFHVRYYGQVNVEDAHSAEWRAREAARKAAKAAA